MITLQTGAMAPLYCLCIQSYDSSALSIQCLESSHMAHLSLPFNAWNVGVYQCVKAYGRSGLTFSMRSVLTQCPAGFTLSGEQLICSSPVNGPPSSQRYDHCTSAGTCACKDPWKRPEGSTYTGERCTCRCSAQDLLECRQGRKVAPNQYEKQAWVGPALGAGHAHHGCAHPDSSGP